MPTKSQSIDLITIAKSRLEQCRSFMVPVLNNVLIGYTMKLSAQVGSFDKIFGNLKKLGAEGLVYAAESYIPEDFKSVNGIKREQAAGFLAFFLHLKLTFDHLKEIAALLQKNQTAAALRELGQLNARIRSLIGETNEDYISLFLPDNSLKIVQRGLDRVLTMSEQAVRILRVAGAQAAA